MALNCNYYTSNLSLYAHSDIIDRYAEAGQKISLPDSASDLFSAKRCLALGAGPGIHEINIIKGLMPKLETLTAIEPDEDSAVALRRNLGQHLPDVEGDVHLTTLEAFLLENDSDHEEQYDVVLMFNMLCHINETDRPRLFRKLSNGLLQPNGHTIIVTNANPNSLPQVIGILGSHRIKNLTVDMRSITTEMSESGHELVLTHDIPVTYNFGSADEELADFFTICAARRVSIDEVEAAARQVWAPDGKGVNVEVLLLYRLAAS